MGKGIIVRAKGVTALNKLKCPYGFAECFASVVRDTLDPDRVYSICMFRS